MKSLPLSGQLSDKLAEIIMDVNEYRPGDKLPAERNLADDLGVSRTAVREALKQLEARGIVEIRHGAGTFVASNPGVVSDPLGLELAAHTDDTVSILSDWYRVRMILEGEAMEMVAQNATDAELEHLSELLDAELTLAQTDDEDFMEEDRGFHCALAHASHNIIMARLIPSLHASIYYDMVRKLYPLLRSRFENNASTNHGRIIHFLKLRDGKGANLAMRCHMLEAIEDISSIRRQLCPSETP